MTESIIKRAQEINDEYNVDGYSWGVFGREPASGFLVVDNGCAGNWHSPDLLRNEIIKGYERYGITEFTIFYAPYKFAGWENRSKVVISVEQ